MKQKLETLVNCPSCKAENFAFHAEVKDYSVSQEVFQLQQCKQCELIFTNPRPAPEHLGPYYESEDYISHTNAKKGLFSQLYQMARSKALKDKLNLLKNYHAQGKVLDVGCGTGHFLSVCKKDGWEVYGVEPSPAAAKIAKEENGIESVSELSQMDGQGPFHIISLWHVMEHLSDLEGNIQAMKSALLPDGRMIVAVPNVEAPERNEYGEQWAAYDVPRHLYHFSKSSMNRLMENNGLEIEHIHPMKMDAYYVSLLSEKIIHGKMRWVKAALSGWKSNRRAKASMNYSSLIYVVKKKN